MNSREIKLKSILLPKWKFKIYLLVVKIKKYLNKEKKTYQNKWFYFSPNWSGFSLSYRQATYDEKAYIQIYFIWGKLFIYPFQKLTPYIKEEYDDKGPKQWGINFFEKTIMFYIGYKYKIYNLPWNLDWIRTSFLKKDNTWEHEKRKEKRKNFWNDKLWENILWEEVYDYTYVLKNGQVQKRKATIKVVEREWRMIWLRWTKKFNYVSKKIDIDFNEEIGEKTGSWKGGTIGCSYEIKEKETPKQTLRRMERERKF